MGLGGEKKDRTGVGGKNFEYTHRLLLAGCCWLLATII